MNGNKFIKVSPGVKQSVNEILQTDPQLQEISNIEEAIHERQMEIIDLEAELDKLQKKRPTVNLEYRESVRWCLNADADNPSYFLKNKESLVRCIEYRHRIDVTPQQNNTIGSVLSSMYKAGLIGRTERSNSEGFFYGIIKFFEKDSDGQYSILKKKYEKDLLKVQIIT